jgi:integrase
MECCALRVSEACGVEQGDLDQGQILVRREVTKTKAGRRRGCLSRLPCSSSSPSG